MKQFVRLYDQCFADRLAGCRAEYGLSARDLVAAGSNSGLNKVTDLSRFKKSYFDLSQKNLIGQKVIHLFV